MSTLYRFRVPLTYAGCERGIDIHRRYPQTPRLLRELCADTVDQELVPLPYQWTEEDVIQWMDSIGFPQYKETLRNYCINGKRIVLLANASLLSRMSIKNFSHIRRITREVRNLLAIEDTQSPRTCYRMFRTMTGPKYELCSEVAFYNNHQIVDPHSSSLRTHWDFLTAILQHDPVNQRIRIGVSTIAM